MGYLQSSMIEYMDMRGYSKRTIQLYSNCIRILAYYYKKSPLLLQTSELYSFMLNLKRNNRSDSTLHVYYEAIKFFYSMHSINERIPKIDFLKRTRKIPQVLSSKEIISIFNECRDLRMKAIFFILYSAGLRLSEVINLEMGDIDFDRRTIFVRNAKNNKNRYTLLSIEADRIIRDYIAIYRPDTLLFFNSQDKERPLSPSCIQRRFKNLVEKAKIIKSVHVHTLRHSFATHLLENGTSIFHIMHLLGHAHIQTTMIYFHMQTNDLSKITSPLDIIMTESNKLNAYDTLFLYTA